MKTWRIVVGDLIVFLLFALLGASFHATNGVHFVDVIRIATPFLIGWFIVASFVGMYKPKAFDSMGKAALLTLLTWIVAAPIGFGLRGYIFGDGNAVPFIIVTLITNTLLLVGWRSGATFFTRRTRNV